MKYVRVMLRSRVDVRGRFVVFMGVVKFYSLWRISFLSFACFAANVAKAVTPVQELAREDVAKSAAIGRAVGSVAGAFAFRKTALGAAGGAAVGGEAGGTAGEAVGEVAAKRRLKYASESDFVEAEIADSKKAIQSKNSEIDRLRSDLANTRAEISELQRRHRENEDVSKEAASTLQDVNEQIARNETQLRRYRAAIEDINEVIASAERQTEPTQGLESKRNDLITRRDNLRSLYKSMEGINEGYEGQKARIKPLAQAETSSHRESDNAPGFQLPKSMPSLNIPSGF